MFISVLMVPTQNELAEAFILRTEAEIKKIKKNKIKNFFIEFYFTLLLYTGRRYTTGPTRRH